MRGGEREGDEACPVVDHRDLGVDMETTVEWPLTTLTESLRPSVVFSLLCSVRTHKLAWHNGTNAVLALTVCAYACLSEDADGLFVLIS